MPNGLPDLKSSLCLFSSVVLQLLLVVLLGTSVVRADCPWPRSLPKLSPLNTACLCAFNLKNEYTVQCSGVPFPLLMRTLHIQAKDVNFDLLYVNNSDIGILMERTFFGLRIRNLQVRPPPPISFTYSLPSFLPSSACLLFFLLVGAASW